MEVQITSASLITERLFRMFRYIPSSPSHKSSAAASSSSSSSSQSSGDSFSTSITISPADLQTSAEMNRKYVLRTKGRYLLIMNDPSKLVKNYKKYYDGYRVISADGNLEMTVCQSETCGSKGFIRDEQFLLFGVINDEQDYGEWTWNTPEKLENDKVALCAVVGGATMCDFRTIVNYGKGGGDEVPIPAFVSFGSEELFKAVVAQMYGDKMASSTK